MSVDGLTTSIRASKLYHTDTSSSCSMLPREHNGVVDPELKVYGTNNVRVVDLSVAPLQFAAHPMGKLCAPLWHGCLRELMWRACVCASDRVCDRGAGRGDHQGQV